MDTKTEITPKKKMVKLYGTKQEIAYIFGVNVKTLANDLTAMRRLPEFSSYVLNVGHNWRISQSKAMRNIFSIWLVSNKKSSCGDAKNNAKSCFKPRRSKVLNGIIGVFNTLLFVRQEGDKNGNKRWLEVLSRKGFRHL
ncbi:hypothetical protein ACFO26_07215 [Lactococcus nasutitermitis]|uniref:DNA-binding protein n=1 Tax=Lactococcus nasutitermitis TaxID=1652957 RepID=A0ABV9JDB0_9LACT|nr:hypothetical protein [Lactococcus nasutitermitis]